MQHNQLRRWEKMNNIQISKNFKLREFQCKDGSQLVKLDSQLLIKLQKLRDLIGKPIIIASGYRTQQYNKKVGGVDDSLHLEGKASDIRINGMSPSQIKRYAEQVGFSGIGIYKSFLHLDIRKTKARWNG